VAGSGGEGPRGEEGALDTFPIPHKLARKLLTVGGDNVVLLLQEEEEQVVCSQLSGCSHSHYGNSFHVCTLYLSNLPPKQKFRLNRCQIPGSFHTGETRLAVFSWSSETGLNLEHTR